jgi:uncharacterized protein (TIGR00251 family)
MRLSIKVIPGASRNEVCGWLGDRLKVRVNAPAEDGKANAAVVRLLAKHFNVPRKTVGIHSGHTSPLKEIELPDSLS